MKDVFARQRGVPISRCNACRPFYNLVCTSFLSLVVLPSPRFYVAPVFIVFLTKIWYTIDSLKLIGGIFMTAEAAWDYAIGMIKVDGLEPTEDFKKYIELEKTGQATTEDLKKYLDKKYKAKEDA